MAIVATLFNDQVTDVAGYSLYSDTRFGGNGDAWGTPEQVVGQDASDADYSRITWDSNLDDGFDTGYVGDSLVITSDDSSNTLIANSEIGGDSSSFSSTSMGCIGNIEIRAFTEVAASVQWSNIQVRFYSGDTLSDSYSVQMGPGVDTTGSSGNTAAQSILRITPLNGDCDRVEIYGMFRMTFDSKNVMPALTDLGAQIFVYPTAN